MAIRPKDEQAYVQQLTAEGFNGRAAFLEWMADERKQDVATLEKRDSLLSTTHNPFDAYEQSEAVSRGAVTFKFHCACCHGEDARGNGPSILPDHPPKDFHDFAHRFASTLHRGAPRRWFQSISEGYGDIVNYPDGPTPAMPAFEEKLTREQIWLVITYLQSLDIHAPVSSHSSADSPPPPGGAK